MAFLYFAFGVCLFVYCGCQARRSGRAASFVRDIGLLTARRWDAIVSLCVDFYVSASDRVGDIRAP